MFKNYKTVMLFDTETLGLNPYLDKIIELGWIMTKDGVEVERGDVLVNWGVKIPDIITEITNITQEEIEEKGITPQEFYVIVSDLLKRSDLIIAHNILFDISFLHHFLLSMGDINGIEDYSLDHFDSLALFVDHIAAGKKPRRPRKNSRDYIVKMEKWEEDVKLIQTHKLDSICRFYGIELTNAHRAIADIEAVYKVLRAFEKNNKGIDMSFYINKLGYKKRWKINEIFYYPHNVELFVQGTNGERYILDAEEHNLFK